MLLRRASSAISAMLVLFTCAYGLQQLAGPYVLAGTQAQQYDAHLVMVVSHGLGLLGLAQPGFWHVVPAVRRLTAVLVLLGGLVLLTTWYHFRHQVAERVAPGIYTLRNP